ncbi:MAG: hypothetical protein KDA24_20980 [Deltaproteobacteria bacterium]|nr:hypothetical protein [Deltaproteobacteria bacterium]
MPEREFEAGENGRSVMVAIDAPSMGEGDLDVEVRVVAAVQSAWLAAREAGPEQPPADSLMHPDQLKALDWLEENEAAVAELIGQAAGRYAFYGETEYNPDLDDERDDPPDAVEVFIELAIIEQPDSAGRCGFRFQGSWSEDEEHGLGVILYDGEIIEIGAQDIAV